MDTEPKDGYSSTNDELNPHAVLTNWIQVIGEFHQWYHQLSEVIKEAESFDYLLTMHVFNRQGQRSIRELKQLQSEVRCSLAGLAEEMEGGLPSLLAIQQLNLHTVTIRYWNNRMQCALGVEPTATA